MEYLRNWLSKRKNNEVNDVKDVKNGVDFYFISNKTLAVIGKRMQE